MNTARLPHHRYRVTAAGWALLALLVFWAIVGLLIARCA